MRRQPKGIPSGGEFAPENKGGNADDLTERVGKPDYPDPELLRDTPNNRATLAWLAYDITLRSGREPWAETREPRDFMEELGFADPDAAIRLCDRVYANGYSPDMTGLDAPGLENLINTDDDGAWLARKASTGYRPGCELLRFGDDGNLESLDRATLEQEAWDMRDSIIDEACDLDLDINEDEIYFD